MSRPLQVKDDSIVNFSKAAVRGELNQHITPTTDTLRISLQTCQNPVEFCGLWSSASTGVQYFYGAVCFKCYKHCVLFRTRWVRTLSLRIAGKSEIGNKID
jgi:hypothetical protein